MPNPVLIQVRLDDREITRGAQQTARSLSNALNFGVSAARQHAQRLEQIARLNAAQLEVIERRKAAQLEVIRARAADRAVEHERKIQRETQRTANALDVVHVGVGRLHAVFGALAAVGVVALFERIGRAAVDAALDIDQQVNTLTALTGSAEAAERRFSQLIALAQKTPGLTTSLAAALDTQLRILNVAEQTINRVLPAIGRLNAIAPLGDPQKFVQNLVQLVTQNFERSDLKELVGQSPFAGNLIKEIFNVSSPTNAKAIREAAKRLGITTVDEFFSRLAEAAENNPRLQAVQESLGSQLEKVRDRLNVALAPVGREIIKTLLPIFDDLVKVVEKYGGEATRVFSANKNDIISAAKAITEMTVEIGKLIAKVVELGTKAGVIEFFATGAAIIQDVLDNPKFLFFIEGPREKAVKQRFVQLAGERAAGAALPQFTSDEEALRRGSPFLTTGTDLLRSSPFLSSTGRTLNAPGAGGAGGGSLGGGTGGEDRGGTAATKRALRDLKAIRDAQIELERTRAEGIVELLKAERDNRLELLEEQYEQGLIRTREFYDEKLKITISNLDAEFALLVQERQRLEESLALAKGEDRIKIETKLAEIYTQQQLKVIELTKVQRENFQEFLKAAELPDLIEAEQVEVIDLAAQARERRAVELRRQASQIGIADIELRREELRIQEAVARGLLTEGEARQAALAVQRQFRDVLLVSLDAQEKLTADPEKIANIRLQVDQVQRLGVEFSLAERFARGFNSQIETVDDAFERLGQNVSRALTNTRDLLNSLKSAVLQFFNDLLGQSLQNLLRSVFAPIVGIFGGGGSAAAGGGIGSIFRTPSTFPANLSASAFQSIASAVGGGGGLSAPPSITALSQFFRPSVPRTAGVVRGGLDEFFGAGVPRTAGIIRPTFGSVLSSVGKSIASAAPFLGLSFGGSLGGQSVAGQILGSAGGFLGGGLVAGLVPGLLSKGAAAFFTNPITAIVGAGLLVGSIFLGRAAQRKRDEEASGQMLTQALQGIEQLASGISSDQIDGSQARGIFESQIIGTFVAQINTLKTKSVRDSRLKNQVRDLRNVFEARIPPLIAEQEQRRRDEATRQSDLERQALIHSKLIPQFAAGGIVPGRDMGFDSVVTLSRPGEMFLTQGQQAGIRALAGADVFSRVGVPGAGQSFGGAQAFQFGGTVQPSSFGLSGALPAINVDVQLVVGSNTAKDIVVVGASTEDGRRVIVRQVRQTQLRGE